MKTRKDTRFEAFLPLSETVFQVLMSLNDKELHGYAIIGAIERNGLGTAPSTSTLYGAIKRMIRDRLIEESEARPDPDLDDERRRYYRLTPRGRNVLRLEAARIQRLAAAARAVGLGGGS